MANHVTLDPRVHQLPITTHPRIGLARIYRPKRQKETEKGERNNYPNRKALQTTGYRLMNGQVRAFCFLTMHTKYNDVPTKTGYDEILYATLYLPAGAARSSFCRNK